MEGEEFQIIIKHFNDTTNTASLTTEQWYDANAYLRSIGVDFRKSIKAEAKNKIDTFYGGYNPND